MKLNVMADGMAGLGFSNPTQACQPSYASPPPFIAPNLVVLNPSSAGLQPFLLCTTERGVLLMAAATQKMRRTNEARISTKESCVITFQPNFSSALEASLDMIVGLASIRPRYVRAPHVNRKWTTIVGVARREEARRGGQASKALPEPCLSRYGVLRTL